MDTIKLTPYMLDTISNSNNEYKKGSSFIKSPEIWEKSREGKGVVIAVIDSGAQVNHPWIKKNILDGWNFTNDYDQNPLIYEDNNGHGTHVTGIITEVAPKSDILVLKALDQKGNASYKWIIDAIKFALEWRGPKGEKVNIICMSLGGPHPNEELHDVIKKAVHDNISVVVAAGNEGDGKNYTNQYSYPGRYNEVIQVGAINFSKEVAPFTNTNEEIDLVAPGVGIVSSYLNSEYASLSGTSMAAPHIAGALALLINLGKLHFNRELSEVEIYAQLIKRTVPLGFLKGAEGNGLVQLDLEEKIKNLVTSDL